MNKLNLILREGGFSLNVADESPTTGYMVSLPDHETILPLAVASDSLVETIVDNYKSIAGEHYVGAWVDDNKIYFDVSENVAERETAIMLGRERKQLGIFDLSSFETIYL